MASNTAAGLNLVNGSVFSELLRKFAQDNALIHRVWTWMASHSDMLVRWLSQPHILAVIKAWSTSFIAAKSLFSVFLGFNPIGIGAGTLAAAFQSWAYGGFTPAGGIFATLTSLGMLGWLAPLQTALAMGIATAVTAVLQICGMGA